MEQGQPVRQSNAIADIGDLSLLVEKCGDCRIDRSANFPFSAKVSAHRFFSSSDVASRSVSPRNPGKRRCSHYRFCGSPAHNSRAARYRCRSRRSSGEERGRMHQSICQVGLPILRFTQDLLQRGKIGLWSNGARGQTWFSISTLVRIHWAPVHVSGRGEATHRSKRNECLCLQFGQCTAFYPGDLAINFPIFCSIFSATLIATSFLTREPPNESGHETFNAKSGKTWQPRATTLVQNNFCNSAFACRGWLRRSG